MSHLKMSNGRNQLTQVLRQMWIFQKMQVNAPISPEKVASTSSTSTEKQVSQNRKSMRVDKLLADKEKVGWLACTDDFGRFGGQEARMAQSDPEHCQLPSF